MKVLLATDGSVYAQTALNSIAARPWPADSSFLVLHVVQSQEHNCIPICCIHADDRALNEDIRKILAEKMVQQTVRLLKRKLQDKTVGGLVCTGQIVERIVETANEWDADMIVLGCRGLTGLTKIHLGSVAEGVVQRALCSVEVIHYNLAKVVEMKHLAKAEVVKNLARANQEVRQRHSNGNS